MARIFDLKGLAHQIDEGSAGAHPLSRVVSNQQPLRPIRRSRIGVGNDDAGADKASERAEQVGALIIVEVVEKAYDHRLVKVLFRKHSSKLLNTHREKCSGGMSPNPTGVSDARRSGVYPNVRSRHQPRIDPGAAADIQNALGLTSLKQRLDRGRVPAAVHDPLRRVVGEIAEDCGCISNAQ